MSLAAPCRHLFVAPLEACVSGALRVLRHHPDCAHIGGVGELVELGIKRGRKTRRKLKVGICGEHGGEPSRVEFCHKVGMDYVSCSPFRVPIARLAAAQAQLSHPRK